MEGVASCLKWLCKLIGAWLNFCSPQEILICPVTLRALQCPPRLQVLVSPAVPACDAAEAALSQGSGFCPCISWRSCCSALPPSWVTSWAPQLWWCLQPWWCALHLLMQPLIKASSRVGWGCLRTARPTQDAIWVLFWAHASCILTFIISWSWFFNFISAVSFLFGGLLVIRSLFCRWSCNSMTWGLSGPEFLTHLVTPISSL